MNIKFNDEVLFNSLIKNTIFKIRIGSHLYNCNNQNSDEDYLYIYLENEENKRSFCFEHHQLQYKKDNIDYNFVTIQNFIRNLFTGDSTINFECLYSDEMKNCLLTSENYINEFSNYNIIKSYLGMAKRDIKFFFKEKDLIEKYKKVFHIKRAIETSKNLINKNKYCNDFSNLKYIKEVGLIEEYSDSEYKKIMENFDIEISNLRFILNGKLEKKEINRCFNIEKMKDIDKYINSLYINRKLENLDYKDLFYRVIENGLDYSLKD